MSRNEDCGIPDPVSVNFSRCVRDALKAREAQRQAPWTITDLARVVGVERKQISNLNRYINIGVSVSGYTHWRPDWMLAIARVLEIPFAPGVTESDSRFDQELVRRLSTHVPANRTVRLRVGLGSEYPDIFEIAFEVYAACADARAREHGGSFQIDIDKPGSRDKVFGRFFANCSDYHILMLDDPWIPEFEPKLLDLSRLPFKEFQDGNILRELFFQPLLEICKFPRESGKLCGLPILGDVDFLCYDTGIAADQRTAKLLSESVIDPDRLKEIVKEQRRQAGTDEQTTSGSRIPFAIRNLDDEDLVENFWLLMRGYGLEDVYHSEQDVEVQIPANLARLSSDWMYDADPEWNRRISGGELLDKMIEGTGPAMTFAWPNTILPRMRNEPSIASRIDWHQFARQPLLGTQVLAIPEGTDRLREQIEAARAILTLTTSSQIQFILSDLGSIPVLNDLPHRVELRNRPFWKENYAKMVEAIKSSHPRPRTPRWREFSRRLAEQLRKRRFSDVPGLMRFV